MENAHLCEQQSRTRVELHTLQVALEQERLEKASAEKELADTRDALVKVQFEQHTNTFQTFLASDPLYFFFVCFFNLNLQLNFHQKCFTGVTVQPKAYSVLMGLIAISLLGSWVKLPMNDNPRIFM